MTLPYRIYPFSTTTTLLPWHPGLSVEVMGVTFGAERVSMAARVSVVVGILRQTADEAWADTTPKWGIKAQWVHCAAARLA